MSLFVMYMIYALGGHLFHLVKKYGESLKRNEAFSRKSFVISEIANLISIPLLLAASDELPETWFKMSKLAAILIGVFSSSMLTGLIDLKKPKELPEN